MTVPNRARTVMTRNLADGLADLVGPGGTMFVAAADPMGVLAFAVRTLAPMTIITNALSFAARIDARRHEVRVLPGRLVRADGTLAGEDTVMTLRGLTVDLALLGCDTVETDGTVLDPDLVEVPVKVAALAIAQRAALLPADAATARNPRAAFASLAAFAAVLERG